MKPEWEKFWSKLFNTVHTWCEYEASIANGFVNNLKSFIESVVIDWKSSFPFPKIY